MQEKTIKLPAGTVHYWQTERKGDRPTIVMMHGLRGTHHGMLKIAAELGDKYNLIIPDLPGFGASQPFARGPADLTNFTKFLGDFMGSLKLKTKPHLLAHSFGTIIASAYAAQNPKAIDKLILLSPIAKNPLPKPLVGVLKPIAALPSKLGRKLTGNNVVADIMSTYTTKTSDPELKKWIKAEHRRYFNNFATNRSMIETTYTSMTNHVGDFAPQITNRTLLIYGQKDNIAGRKGQQNLHKFIANCRSQKLRGIGHLTPYEAPASVAAAVDKFITGDS
jgi:pimeloyl-ACP methyl ester carboxylesterase